MRAGLCYNASRYEEGKRQEYYHTKPRSHEENLIHNYRNHRDFFGPLCEVSIHVPSNGHSTNPKGHPRRVLSGIWFYRFPEHHIPDNILGNDRIGKWVL